VACDKVFEGKRKVIWETVCKPKEFGGLGIPNLKKKKKICGPSHAMFMA
jgi:hypothetical protein